MLKPMYCAITVHVEEPQVVEMSAALHYGVLHNHIVVLECTTAEIVTVVHLASYCSYLVYIELTPFLLQSLMQAFQLKSASTDGNETSC